MITEQNIYRVIFTLTEKPTYPIYSNKFQNPCSIVQTTQDDGSMVFTGINFDEALFYKTMLQKSYNNLNVGRREDADGIIDEIYFEGD